VGGEGGSREEELGGMAGKWIERRSRVAGAAGLQEIGKVN
jgi:hypothetical protein